MNRSGPHEAPGSFAAPPVEWPRRAALFALAVLFGMNLLNYVDRYVFFSVGELIQRDLHFDDRQYGVLSVAFMVVYTVVSPLMGWLGDRYNRRHLLAFGVGLWSVATVGTAHATSFSQMFLWRALLGIGEASYGVIAPALLSDLFAPRYRGRILGLYYLALPLGGALGYLLGGEIGARHGWRGAFWVVGLPGLALAVAGLLIHDPGRGASEGLQAGLSSARPRLSDYLSLFRTPSFLLNSAGLATVTFVSGAYAAWGATFYQRVHGLPPDQAGRWIGGLTALAGLVGIGAGSLLADWLFRRTRRAYLLFAGAAVVIAAPFGLLAMIDPYWRSSLLLLFVAMVLLAAVLGPCNTVTANVVPAQLRAAGFAVSIFLIHLFGDISSPILIGELSQWSGQPEVAGSALGRLLTSFGINPVETPRGPTNLTVGMLTVIPVMLIGGLFFLLGSRHLPSDEERARRASLLSVPVRRP